MRIPFTLSLYFARSFLSAVLMMLGALTGLVALFDFIELLRRASTKPNVGFQLVTQISLLHLPWNAMQLLPFAVLLGGILAFWRLGRASELIVARAAGISVWGFLSAPIAAAVGLGLFSTFFVSPLSAMMFARAERLDNTYLKSAGGPLALAGGQLWLRQADHGITPDGVAILHGESVALQMGNLQIKDVSVFRLDANDHLEMRLQASQALLRPGAWVLQNVTTLRPDQLPSKPESMSLPTDLTARRVEESFASPDTLSVWVLPGFIDQMERSGFSAVRHRLHFQALLALPLLCGTMGLVAAGFSMRQSRRGGVAKMVGAGVAAGFALFILSKVAQQFGESGVLPPLLAAWAPAASGLMLAVALLLHLEDG